MIAIESQPRQTTAGVSLALVSRRLVAEMESAGVSDPLSQPVTVAVVLADLFRLAGQPVPRDIAEPIG